MDVLQGCRLDCRQLHTCYAAGRSAGPSRCCRAHLLLCSSPRSRAQPPTSCRSRRHHCRCRHCCHCVQLCCPLTEVPPVLLHALELRVALRLLWHQSQQQQQPAAPLGGAPMHGSSWARAPGSLLRKAAPAGARVLRVGMSAPPSDHRLSMPTSPLHCRIVKLICAELCRSAACKARLTTGRGSAALLHPWLYSASNMCGN